MATKTNRRAARTTSAAGKPAAGAAVAEKAKPGSTTPRAKAGRAVARPAGQPIKRQAIVVVHGQGQQRPMGTIRDFVKVLWTNNPDVVPEPPNGRETWIVPDDKSGLYELQRITTPPHDDGRRTDFFELYYADLLADTPLRNLWRWLVRLLWVDPAAVPKRMHWPWTAFWLLMILAAVLSAFVVFSAPQLLHGNWLSPFSKLHAWVGLAIFLIGLAMLLVPKFLAVPDALGELSEWMLVLVVMVGLTIVYWGTAVPVAAVLGYLAYFAGHYLLPLFGDAASYLSAQTDTVRSRQALRERGLKLLQALHHNPEYDRVVIVAHSLGTVLAYDLLQLLWHSVGPTKDNPPSAAAVAALERVRDFGGKRGAWTAADVENYQRLQWDAYQGLRTQKPVAASGTRPATPGGWKVSDYISLGSPLASAQFLVTEGESDFSRMKEERVLPTSPPQPRDNAKGFLYEEDGVLATHHAAVFSTVRWTNIYDEFDPTLFFQGDVIGGPVSAPQILGPGIRDIDVRILRGGKRFFSHNHYWVDADEEKTGKPSTLTPPQITLLREAVGLSRQ